MQKSKLFDLFRSLHIEEWKKLDQFLRGRTESSSEVFRLFRYIYGCKKDLDHTKLKIDRVNRKLFRNKTRKNFLNIMSRLRRIVIDYLLWDDLQSNQDLKKVLLIETYNRRGLYGEADKIHNEHFRSNGYNKPIDLLDPVYDFLVNHYHYFSDNPVKLIQADNLLKKGWDTLEMSYRDLSLFYLTEAKSISQLSNPSRDLNSVLYDDARHRLIEHSDNLLLSHLYRLKVHQSSASFNWLYTSLIERAPYSDSIKLIVLIYCSKYLTTQLSRGHLDQKEKIFELFQFGLEEGFYLFRGQLSQSRYLNMVDYAVNLGYSDWADQMIGEWSYALPESGKENNQLLAMAMIQFGKEEYGDVLTYLSRLSGTNLAQRMRARWLSIKAYYELYQGHDEFMKDQIHNYEEFFKRNKKRISHKNYLGSLGLARMITGLIKGESTLTLSKKLEDGSPYNSQTWLRKKLKMEKAPTI